MKSKTDTKLRQLKSNFDFKQNIAWLLVLNCVITHIMLNNHTRATTQALSNTNQQITCSELLKCI